MEIRDITVVRKMCSKPLNHLYWSLFFLMFSYFCLMWLNITLLFKVAVLWLMGEMCVTVSDVSQLLILLKFRIDLFFKFNCQTLWFMYEYPEVELPLKFLTTYRSFKKDSLSNYYNFHYQISTEEMSNRTPNYYNLIS